jgi:N-acyl-D-amino-acid deacylase
MAPWRGLYVTHVRYKKGTLAGVQEAVDIGERSGVPVHISHLKAGSVSEAEEILAYVDRVAIHAVDFSFDIYPYSAGSTMFNFLLPYEVWEDGPLAVVDKLRDPAIRERTALLLECFPLPAEKIRFAWCATNANLRHRGQSLAQIAAALGKSPADTVCDLVTEENLAALSVLEGGDDRLIDPFLQHPKFMLGTDGIYFPDGLVHPRVYGSASRMIGPLVRERKLFSLEQAVQKMTGIPADRFGLTDRGSVREGFVADLVIFDPQTVADRATHADPHQLSAGVDHVFTSGVEVFAAGAALTQPGPEQPGRALRFKH